MFSFLISAFFFFFNAKPANGLCWLKKTVKVLPLYQSGSEARMRVCSSGKAYLI